jgi:hypothetical protein
VKSTAKTKRPGPLSIQLSPTERRRLVAHAKKRRLKVSTAARVFIDEHLTELEDRIELSAAEEWQKAQAWATWEKIKAGDTRWVTQDEIDAVFAKAKRRSLRRSKRTS